MLARNAKTRSKILNDKYTGTNFLEKSSLLTKITLRMQNS